MKKYPRKSILIAIAFFALFNSVTLFSFANDSSHIAPAIAVELRYAGMIKNDPVFCLSILGDPGKDKFTLSITDMYGNNLYRENIRGEKFTKNFLLNTEELGDEMLRFEV